MKTDKLKTAFNNFLDTKFGVLKTAHKAAIFAGVIVVPAVAFYFLAFQAKAEEITRLDGERNGLRDEITRLKSKEKEIDKLKAEQAECEKRFQVMTEKLPKDKEIPSLLTNVSSLGSSSGLDFLSFRPRGESVKEFYAEIPVDIEVQGLYHNVGLFLDRVSKLDRIVNISNVTMGTPTLRDGKMQLKTSFNLVTYRYIPPPEGQPQGGQKK